MTRHLATGHFSARQFKPSHLTLYYEVEFLTGSILVHLRLEVLANGKIIVPGCEPSSVLTSKTLSAYLAKYGCGSALVDLDDALEAIPGSFVEYGVNFGPFPYRKRWFVLPPRVAECPCPDVVDYYEILKSLATTELPEEEEFDKCNMIGMGFCPSPDFKEVQAPEPSPYQDEGSFPIGGGILPPIPPWIN